MSITYNASSVQSIGKQSMFDSDFDSDNYSNIDKVQTAQVKVEAKVVMNLIARRLNSLKFSHTYSQNVLNLSIDLSRYNQKPFNLFFSLVCCLIVYMEKLVSLLERGLLFEKWEFLIVCLLVQKKLVMIVGLYLEKKVASFQVQNSLRRKVSEEDEDGEEDMSD